MRVRVRSLSPRSCSRVPTDSAPAASSAPRTSRPAPPSRSCELALNRPARPPGLSRDWWSSMYPPSRSRTRDGGVRRACRSAPATDDARRRRCRVRRWPSARRGASGVARPGRTARGSGDTAGTRARRRLAIDRLGSGDRPNDERTNEQFTGDQIPRRSGSCSISDGAARDTGRRPTRHSPLPIGGEIRIRLSSIAVFPTRSRSHPCPGPR
jgi:hypothetical protein